MDTKKQGKIPVCPHQQTHISPVFPPFIPQAVPFQERKSVFVFPRKFLGPVLIILL